MVIGNRIEAEKRGKSTQFQKGNHIVATPEQKKAGWERKKNGQKIMDMILKYQTMNKDELKNFQKENDSTLTILEHQMIRYVLEGNKDNKMLIDMINRHVSYAPVQQEHSGPDGEALVQITPEQMVLIAKNITDNLSTNQ